MLEALALSAVSRGVNKPTLLVLNIALALLWLSLAYLVFHTATTEGLGDLTPHFGLLLAVCTFLWLLINWFVAQTGLVDTADQAAALRAPAEDEGAPEDEGALSEKQRAALAALPLQSDLNVGLGDAAGFDTSSLAIQPLQQTDLLPPGKDKQR